MAKEPRKLAMKKKTAKRRPAKPAEDPVVAEAEQTATNADKKASTKRRPKSKAKKGGWAAVVFTDLHVNANTIDNAVWVLKHVGQQALALKAMIICLGDFWDIRGNINVRQLDKILAVLREWEAAGIEVKFIPGNHDQVTRDGLVHGMNVFAGFSNIEVITDPHLIPDAKMAFLPWRDDDELHARQFTQIAGDDWAIFAHAEVGGALTNNGHKTPGKVSLTDIESVSRACYLGHFHKRQLMGESTWYLGSPFQQNMSERDQPHGIAIIREGVNEPEFIELEEFPRYHRFHYDEKVWDFGAVRKQDIVEVVAPSDVIGTEEYFEAISVLDCAKVRPKSEAVAKAEEAPAFALALGDDAIEAWVAKQTAADEDTDQEWLTQLGKEILSSVPEAFVPQALGPVTITRMVITNFCRINGTIEWDFDKGTTLLRGPIKQGKTAIADAPMWCLYDSTSPRKAGSAGSTFRGDGVISDDADECSVTLALRIGGEAMTITRSKKRGSSSKVDISGDVSTGYSDSQQIIDRLIGMDQDMWRACVSLGQGAVANFVTDTDKVRKELLSVPMGLAACPKAQEVARARKSAAMQSLAKHEQEHIALDAKLETLRRQDLTQEAEAWDATHKGALDQIKTDGAASSDAVAKALELLRGEPEWLETRTRLNTQMGQATDKLKDLRPATQIAELQRQYGKIEAERAMVTRDESEAKKLYASMVSSGAATCPECGQALDSSVREQHMQGMEQKVRSLAATAQGLMAQLSNVGEKLDQLNTHGVTGVEQIEIEIADAREGLSKAGEALNQFTRIRVTMEQAQSRLERLRADFTTEATKKNPFTARIEQVAIEIETTRGMLKAVVELIDKAKRDVDDLEFWIRGFGPKGLPVLILRTVLHELETAANKYLSQMLQGELFVQLAIEGDSLKILYQEMSDDGVLRERTYEKLSGGQRRCVELAFSPFALRDVIYNRTGAHVGLLIIDELTTHMGQNEKPRACDILSSIDCESVLVIDHDPTVQGYFDNVLDLVRDESGVRLVRA